MVCLLLTMMPMTNMQQGSVGEDITSNVELMQHVPLSLKKQSWTGEVRGEIICPLSVHAKHFPDASSPRNTASGVARRADGAGSSLMRVSAYSVSPSFIATKSKFVALGALSAAGFSTPAYYKCATLADVTELMKRYEDTVRSTLDYAIDGLVVEIDDMDTHGSLGVASGRPVGARACKFESELKVAKLLAIEWQAGQDSLTPVAVFTAADFSGASVTRASLSNPQIIASLWAGRLPRVGDELLVSRRGDVIPYIESVEPSGTGAEIKLPETCPICTTRLDTSGSTLRCPNPSCGDALGRSLLRYIKGLDIKGWGPSIVEALVSQHIVASIPDLYQLKESDLALVKTASSSVGAKKASTLIASLQSKQPTLAQFLSACSPPGLGSVAFDAICCEYRCRPHHAHA